MCVEWAYRVTEAKRERPARDWERAAPEGLEAEVERVRRDQALGQLWQAAAVEHADPPRMSEFRRTSVAAPLVQAATSPSSHRGETAPFT